MYFSSNYYVQVFYYFCYAITMSEPPDLGSVTETSVDVHRVKHTITQEDQWVPTHATVYWTCVSIWIHVSIGLPRDRDLYLYLD